MLSITLQVNLHIAVHARKYCISDAFQSHNQNKGHMFEDDENKATIVAQSKQSVKIYVVNMVLDLPHHTKEYKKATGLMAQLSAGYSSI